MATVAVEAGDREFSIGRVFGLGFGTIAAHPFATLAIALVFGSLPTMITAVMFMQLIGSLSAGWIFLSALAAMPLNTCWHTLVQASLSLTTIAHSQGRRADIVDTLPPVLMRLLPVVLLGLVIGVGLSFGLVLLIVPAVLLLMTWLVAASAMVAERLNIPDALERSSALTKGARWKLFGIELILGVSFGLINLALRAGGMGWMEGVRFGLIEMRGPALAALGLNLVIQTVSAGVYAVMRTSAYVELREWKEGPPADSLAEVFR